MSTIPLTYFEMNNEREQLSMSFATAEELGIKLYSKWFFPSRKNVGIITNRHIDYTQKETFYTLLDVKNETVTDVKVSDFIKWVENKQLFRVPINELEVTHG